VIENYISATLNFWWKIGISAGIGILMGGTLYFCRKLIAAICVCLIPVSVGLLGFALGMFICSLVLATPLGPSLFDKANWAPLVSIGLCGM
jgi:hypothetical protein